MILIADSGSTKTTWCLVKPDIENDFCQTEGYNPYFVGTEYIASSLRSNMPDQIIGAQVSEIHFYGAGCASGMDSVVSNALGQVFAAAEIHIEMDLLAAARALLGNQPGFAAILGTGCNTCLYDGNTVIQNIDSLGFILGDEGSGGAIGKKLLSDVIRGNMPARIIKLFNEKYGYTAEDIIHRIYTEPMANRFCSGFCTFVKAHIGDPYMHQLVKDCFKDFFENLVSKYPRFQDYSFNSIGSIGYHFSDIIREVCSEYNMRVGRMLESPMLGLVAFHQDKHTRDSKQFG